MKILLDTGKVLRQDQSTLGEKMSDYNEFRAKILKNDFKGAITTAEDLQVKLRLHDAKLGFRVVVEQCKQLILKLGEKNWWKEAIWLASLCHDCTALVEGPAEGKEGVVARDIELLLERMEDAIQRFTPQVKE